MDLQIDYSLFGKTIKKQLKEKNLIFTKSEVQTIQELSFAVINLQFHEIISQSEVNVLIEKIHNRLLININRLNQA